MQRTSNVDVKKLNRNRVFRLINRHERMSRPEIAHTLGLSGPTVLFLTNELLARGFIREEGELDSTGGRKAKALSPIHDLSYAVGLDLTANHIGFVLTDLSSAVLRKTRLQKTFANTPAYFRGAAECLDDFIAESGIDTGKLLGVGVSVPGIIDMEKQRIAHSHVFNIHDIPCEEWSRYIPYETAFINDANAAAVAEIHNIDDDYTGFYLSLSNSVGGAIISRKGVALGESRSSWQGQNLYLGYNFKSGEIGHATLVPGGLDCYCGKQGCFDAYCSAKRLSRLTNGKLEFFFEGLAAGVEEYAAEWRLYLDNLAVEINNIRMLMDCDIIIGGYVGSFIEPYMGELRARLRARNTFGEDADYLRNCKYRKDASALGAALLHIEANISRI